MVSMLSSIKTKSRTFLEGQLGAVAFEYLLLIGGVSAVVVGLLVFGVNSLGSELIEFVCERVDETLGLVCEN